MTMDEIKEQFPNCPNCGRHCPIDATSCPRGEAFVKALLSGEMSPEEARAAQEQGGEHGPRHGAHGGSGGEHGRQERERGHGHPHFEDDGSLASLLHQCMHKLHHGEGTDPFAMLSEGEQASLREMLEKILTVS